MVHDPEKAFLRLLEGLDRLECPYMVGGSGASSVHGFWRSTNDIDLVARITLEQLDEFEEEFRAEFYVDRGQMRQAIIFGRAFNIIHVGSAYKFDIFPLGSDPFHQKQFSRRRYESAALFGGEKIEVSVASPEDVILSKLHWFRKGREVSSQQWNDILGVIAMQRPTLDLPYLRQWAEHLNVSDLLEAALTERHGN